MLTVFSSAVLSPLVLSAGIGHKSLRPSLGLIDPDSMVTLPSRVAAWSGFDVLW